MSSGRKGPGEWSGRVEFSDGEGGVGLGVC